MKFKVFILVGINIFIYSNTLAQTNVRGWYADGQVWIVWESDTLNEPKTYAIYSSPTPVSDANQATLIGRLFKEEWTPGAVFVDSLAPNPRYVIPDGSGNKYIVKAHEGLFVETVHQTGSNYYAVLKMEETVINAGINSTANPVNFTYSEAEPVQCHLQDGMFLPTGNYSELYYMWADGKDDHRSGRPDFPIMANRHKNGMPSLFVVWDALSMPADTLISAVHWLHGGEGTVSQNLPGKRELIDIQPKDGIIISHNDDLPGFLGKNYRFETSNTWWFGWRKNLNPFDTTLAAISEPDTVINYTQRRIIWINDWLIKNRNVDPNRVSIQGHSMGSTGAIHIAKAFPNTFASSSIFNNGFHVAWGNNSIYLFGMPDDNIPTNLINRKGNIVTVTDLSDLTTNISPERDLPVMKSWHGKNDVSIMEWDAFVVDEYRRADSSGMGMQLYWDERGHRIGNPRGYWAKGVSPALQTQRDDAAYQERFRVRQSYPAFFNHRSYPKSGDPGDGTKGTGGAGNGDDWGTWGGYHEWDVDNIVDTQTSWEAVAYLIGQSEYSKDNCPFVSLQADLSIRKPQQFLPVKGTQVNWHVVQISTGDTLQQGVTTVGDDDLVTVQGVTLYRDPHRVRISFSAVLTSIQDNNHHSHIMNFELKQNYPNPFNPETTITYDLSQTSDVQLSIYNMLGQKVRTLIRDRQFAGNHQIVWNGRNDSGFPVSSGIYLYRLRAGNFVKEKKMLMIR